MHHPSFAVAYRDLAAACARAQPRLVISISDPGQAPSDADLARAAPGAAIVRLAYNADQGRGSTWITPSDVHTVHMAVLDQPDDATVVVHCGAGSVRSPAMALVVRAMQAGYDSDTPLDLAPIVAAWSKDHPHAEPHMRTLGCADVYFRKRRRGFEETMHAFLDSRVVAPPPGWHAPVAKAAVPARKPLYGTGSKTRLKGFRP